MSRARAKAAGPIVDLGSHQIDIYGWFLGANPSHVMASGGSLYYDPKTHEWYETLIAFAGLDRILHGLVGPPAPAGHGVTGARLASRSRRY